MPALYDITPFSLLDYPDEMSCIVWFAGCNMRCVYCHNPAIVTAKGGKDEAELFSFLDKRRGKLTAVVFSGGEATLYAGLIDIARRVREMGFKIKLDTNGSRPEALKKLLKEKLLDYVAMDYKCPPHLAAGLIGTDKLWPLFQESLGLMIEASAQGEVTFEVRTTVSPDLMDEAALNDIIRDLGEKNYKGTYYIQNVFAHGEKTIGKIDAPSRKVDPALLDQPQGFTLAFRNS